VTDARGATVSTGIGTDTAPTADEVTYPDNSTFVPGAGYLNRAQFYVDGNGQSTGVTTPYYQLLEAAWATPSQ
jgi:hypothetical protein